MELSIQQSHFPSTLETSTTNLTEAEMVVMKGRNLCINVNRTVRQEWLHCITTPVALPLLGDVQDV
jgi:hypothetical protein